MANEITTLGEKLFFPSLQLNKDSFLLIFTHMVSFEPHNNANKQGIYIIMSILQIYSPLRFRDLSKSSSLQGTEWVCVRTCSQTGLECRAPTEVSQLHVDPW